MNNSILTNIRKNYMSYIILIPITVILLFPFYWMVITSFKPMSQIFEFPPQFIPDPVKWSNYVDLFKEQKLFPVYYYNSTYISLLVTVGICMLSSLAGYAFAKIRFKFRDVIFLILLSKMMIPGEALLIPTYIMMSKLKWIDTHLPLIVPSIFGGGGIFGLFLMRQFFLTVPDSIDEAARIDGSSPWNTFIHIMFPLCKNTLFTVAILTFLSNWNSLLEPLIYLNKPRLYTLPIALTMFNDMGVTDWSLKMAASVLAVLPLLIAFFLAQKQFVESIALSGIK